MTKIYDLESNLMSCWNITEDLDVLCHHVVDVVDYGKLDTDQIANVLIGLRTLYDMKFSMLFEQYEELVREQHKLNKE